MDDDTDLVLSVNKSTLTSEDKLHWIQILPKLNPQQKDLLKHSLIVKTEIKTAIALINKALSVISEAESEADRQNREANVIPTDTPLPPVVEPQIPPGNQTVQTTSQLPDTQKQNLVDERAMQEAKLSEIRDELKKISLEVHGSPPPSYNS